MMAELTHAVEWRYKTGICDLGWHSEPSSPPLINPLKRRVES
jgi:hypothetical protein